VLHDYALYKSTFTLLLLYFIDTFLVTIHIEMRLKFLASGQGFFLTDYLLNNLNFSLLLFFQLRSSYAHYSK